MFKEEHLVTDGARTCWWVEGHAHSAPEELHDEVPIFDDPLY